MATIKEKVTAAILSSDSKIREIDPEFMDQAVLLASAMIGADEKRIAEELGFDREYVSLVGSRLRAAGIWRGAEMSDEHLTAWEGEMGGIAFGLDANVAGGSMVVTDSAKRGGPHYSMTEAGTRKVEAMKKGKDQ
jgi:hypothetical protein